MVLMLSRQRILALFALLGGVLLLATGAILPRFLPVDEPTPLDLGATTISLEDPAATVGEGYQPGEREPQEREAPVVRQFHLTQGAPADETKVSGRVGVTTRREDVDDDLNALLEAQVYTFRADRFSGEVVGGTGQVADTPATPSVEVPMQGAWAKFPQNAQQEAYDYFDYTLRASFPAEFSREEVRKDSAGRDVTVYIYEQRIDSTNVAESYQGIRNEIALPEGVEVDVAEGQPRVAQLYHSATRELAVEPASGLIVGVTEHTTDEYKVRGADGQLQPVQTLLDFEGKTAPEAEAQLLTQAAKAAESPNATMWSLALIAAGVMVSAVSLFFVVRPQRRRYGEGE